MRILSLLPLLGLLAACAAPQQRPEVVRDSIGNELAQAAAGRKTAEVAERGLLMPLTVEMPKQENNFVINTYPVQKSCHNRKYPNHK